MQLSMQRAAVLRDVLAAIHLRDEDLGLLPAVDRGPPRGLLDATVRAVRLGLPLPDLRQLPPNVGYAARALQLLAAHPITASQIDDWLARNLEAALADTVRDAGTLPIEGCRSHEDVRNRLLVGIDELTPEELEAFDEAVRDVLATDLV